jgi:hypothetical protein
MMKLTAYLVLAMALFLGGCSHVPPRPARPSLDPVSAARAAMDQYDLDHDGKIDANELKKCPALAEAMDLMDANRDGVLTLDEITARLRKWKDSSSVVASGSTRVFLDGQPLAGATVTYEPEKFMGPAFESSSGVTDSAGFADIKGHDAKYPGLYLGLYRVRISKVQGGRETLPARYNTETILAKEVAPDVPRQRRLLRFDLQSQ